VSDGAKVLNFQENWDCTGNNIVDAFSANLRDFGIVQIVIWKRLNGMKKRKINRIKIV